MQQWQVSTAGKAAKTFCVYRINVVTLHVILPYASVVGAVHGRIQEKIITEKIVMLNLILCGAPGSGKGTQSEFIVKKYGLEHLSTGDLLRREIASGSRFGKQIDAIISKGNLVPDDVMLRLIDQYMESLSDDCKGVIFDGFPRTLNQAIEFEKMLAHKQTPAHLIDLEVAEDELIERLLNRGKTSGRSDDNLETIRKRLTVYHHQTEPVSGYYKELGKYHSVNGTGSVEDIFERIAAVIDSL